MVPLGEERLSLPWVVLRDASGWHRAKWIHDLLREEMPQAVDRSASYRGACRTADELNAVAEVQDG